MQVPHCIAAAVGKCSADLDLQQILPDGERPFGDVLLPNAKAIQVCHFDGPALASQKLQSVEAGAHIALCLLTQPGQSLNKLSSFICFVDAHARAISSSNCHSNHTKGAASQPCRRHDATGGPHDTRCIHIHALQAQTCWAS